MAAVKKAMRPSAGRRVVQMAKAGAASAATGTKTIVRRVYSGARGGIARAKGVAANARARAAGILSGSTGRIVAMVVGVAAMVALIPLLKNIFKLDKSPNGAIWLAGIFLGIALLLWRGLNKPAWALMAGGVAGFIIGTEALDRWFKPSPPTMARQQPVQSLPDRVQATPTSTPKRTTVVSGPGTTQRG